MHFTFNEIYRQQSRLYQIYYIYAYKKIKGIEEEGISDTRNLIKVATHR